MKALSPDKGRHTPLKATAALPQAVIPNEVRTRGFDEQMDSYNAVSEGRIAATRTMTGTISTPPPGLLGSNTVASLDLPGTVGFMPSVPVASTESFLTDVTPQTFGSNVVASISGEGPVEDDGALPQAVIPLPYLGAPKRRGNGTRTG